MAAVSQRAQGFVGKSSPGARVDRAVGAARVAVGRLQNLWSRVVLRQRTRPVGELQRIGIIAEIDIADEGPIGCDLLLPLYAEVGLAKAVRHALPSGAMALLAHDLLHAVRIGAVELSVVAFLAKSNVKLTVECDAPVT